MPAAYKNFSGVCRNSRDSSQKESMPKFYQDNVKIRFSNTHVKFEVFSPKQTKNELENLEHERQMLNIV